MKKGVRSFIFAMFMFALSCGFVISASAEWVADGTGSYAYRDQYGTYLTSTWLVNANAGLVKIGGKTYCLNKEGNKIFGLVRNGAEAFYFHKTKGYMRTRARIKLNGHWYYFGEDGKMIIGQWIDKRYYGEDGAMVVKSFVGQRYVGSNGLYITGLKKKNGSYYYFQPSDGTMLTGTTAKINNKMYVFDAYGKGSLMREASVPVHDTYYTDPEVDDETLLASIIYCEAGNQPYYGQVAVGLVITNRMRSPLFPNKLAEVIYATMQFEPARNGALTNALNGKIHVSDSCRAAAHEVMRMYTAGDYKITKENGKKKSMKGYFFFMTPSAFSRLGLISKKIVLKDHVFFKLWQRG